MQSVREQQTLVFLHIITVQFASNSPAASPSNNNSQSLFCNSCSICINMYYMITAIYNTV